jgi:hypothetical protein
MRAADSNEKPAGASSGRSFLLEESEKTVFFASAGSYSVMQGARKTDVFGQTGMRIIHHHLYRPRTWLPTVTEDYRGVLRHGDDMVHG